MDSVLPLTRVFVNTREVALSLFDHSQPAYERLVFLFTQEELPVRIMRKKMVESRRFFILGCRPVEQCFHQLFEAHFLILGYERQGTLGTLREVKSICRRHYDGPKPAESENSKVYFRSSARG